MTDRLRCSFSSRWWHKNLSLYLFWYLTHHQGVRADWISVAATYKQNQKNKEINKIDKADRIKDRFWQIPASFHWNKLKGKTKEGRGGWGRRVVSKWAMVLQSQQMVWRHISSHGYTWDLRSQATTRNQACASRGGGVVFVFEGGPREEMYYPPPGKSPVLCAICLSS